MTFAGTRSRTADQMKLNLAKNLELSGNDEPGIYQATQWFRGADDQWRYEIDDSSAKFMGGVESTTNSDHYLDWMDEAGSRSEGVSLARVLCHPELFAAYPVLATIRVVVDNKESLLNASYMHGEGLRQIIKIPDPYNLPQEKYLQLLPVMMHEIQHAIQKFEGYEQGLDFNTYGSYFYRHCAGEVEARNVQFRQMMTAAQRAIQHPFSSIDVDRGMILRMSEINEMHAANVERRTGTALDFIDNSEVVKDEDLKTAAFRRNAR